MLSCRIACSSSAEEPDAEDSSQGTTCFPRLHVTEAGEELEVPLYGTETVEERDDFCQLRALITLSVLLQWTHWPTRLTLGRGYLQAQRRAVDVLTA